MSNDIYLFNTLTRKKELFVPIDKNEVRVYSCWPTVYGEPHIGNFRAFMLADLLRWVLKHVWWYSVKHVMNITDVGHLTDDWDHWEDKMEKWARKEWKTVWEVARMYENNFHTYLKEFNIDQFDKTPRATEHILEQINMVKTLTKKGFTYVIPDDGIYMDTSKIPDYWKLAKLDVEGLSSQFRNEWASIDAAKKNNITDFSLRKFSPKNAQRWMERVYDWPNAWALLVSWDAPSEWKWPVCQRDSLNKEEQFSQWFPWWHVECSAMSVEYLWSHFDIHTWWVDHIPVHHTNEIAQTECCYGIEKWVNYRLHQQFLNIDWGKMSKSKWHDLSVPWVVASWYSPLDIRYFYMTAQYSSFLDYSEEAIEAAKVRRTSIINKLTLICKKLHLEIDVDFDLIEWKKLYSQLTRATANDLNTPKALSFFKDALKVWSEDDFYDILLFDEKILKCWFRDWIRELLFKNHEVSPEIRVMWETRFEAKNNKNYALSDSLRSEIANAWWKIIDTPDWFEFEKL